MVPDFPKEPEALLNNLGVDGSQAGHDDLFDALQTMMEGIMMYRNYGEFEVVVGYGMGDDY